MRLTVRAFFGSRQALWIAPFAGAALSLAFAPFDFWPLAILCPAFLFLTWRDASPKRAAQLGFVFTAGMYFAGTYWLYHSIHGIGKAPLLLTFFVMFAMVAILSSYTAFVGYAVKRWLFVSTRSPDSSNSPPTHEWGLIGRYLLILPAAWLLLEWFRGWFLSGFPWLALGYSHLDTALAGWAPVGGVYTMSFIVAACAGALALLVIGPQRVRITALVAAASLWLAGYALNNPEWTQPIGAPVTVAIVQGAVPQDLKWSAEHRDSTIALYFNLSAPHLGTDIIVWPESALPILGHEAMEVMTPLASAARARGSALVTGLVRYDFERDEYYNGLVAMDEEAQWYYKRRLVPFGEFFPVPSFVREWLKLMNLPYSDITPGEQGQPALQVKNQKLAVTICYEDAYGAEQLDVLKEATLLVNVTNDAWFGDSTAAHQHLQISRMRALEAGRPMLRAANDGISAFIDARGEVQSTLPRFKPGVLTGVVQPRTGLTPYAVVGNTPIVVVGTLILLAAGGPRVISRVRRQRTAADEALAKS